MINRGQSHLATHGAHTFPHFGHTQPVFIFTSISLELISPWWTSFGLEPKSPGCRPGVFPIKRAAHYCTGFIVILSGATPPLPRSVGRYPTRGFFPPVKYVAKTVSAVLIKASETGGNLVAAPRVELGTSGYGPDKLPLLYAAKFVVAAILIRPPSNS